LLSPLSRLFCINWEEKKTKPCLHRPHIWVPQPTSIPT
jgi:hypothetical protein